MAERLLCCSTRVKAKEEKWKGSMRRGQGKQDAWRPRGDDGLTPIGHCRLKFLIQ